MFEQNYDVNSTPHLSPSVGYWAWCSLLMVLVFPGPLLATGWSPGDQVIDFGISLADGERQVLADAASMRGKFSVRVLWQMDPESCRLETRRDADARGAGQWVDVQDDGRFLGRPGHAVLQSVDALALTGAKGTVCDIGSRTGEFVAVSSDPTIQEREHPGGIVPPIGATVVLLRATAFYTPREVRVKAGQKVVWLYADGTREPHTVTSGACRGSDCSGGGAEFSSGLTLLRPGDQFEHLFQRPGVHPYHCDLHTAVMQGAVVVEP